MVQSAPFPTERGRVIYCTALAHTHRARARNKKSEVTVNASTSTMPHHLDTPFTTRSVSDGGFGLPKNDSVS